MRLVVITFGTEGDVRPIVALSQGLREGGHAVKLLAERGAQGSARDAGVPFEALTGDMQAAMAPDGPLGRVLQSGRHDVSATARALADIAQSSTADWMAHLSEAARDADAIVFSGLCAYVGLSVADTLELPAIGAGLFPISPTREFPSPFLPPWRLPGPLNLWSHRMVMGLLWRMFRRSLNDARRRMGQPPRRRMWEGYPNLYGVSPSLVPQPHDWPAHWQICGAWSLPASAWTPPPGLEAFLAAGEPPMYVGFGSMAGFDRRVMLDTIVAALRGRRALFYPGWSGIAADALPANFHVIGAVPHDRLFPRCALVVHHGGAGTSHTAAAAGVPSVVVPFAGDQSFWADRLARAGIAPVATPAAKLNADVLARGIDEAQSAAMRERATQLGRRMRAERGIERAVALIERHVTSMRAAGSTGMR